MERTLIEIGFVGCQSLTIVLIPNTSLFQNRRSDDVHLSSLMTFNCDQPFSISIKWTISNSSKVELNLPQVEREHPDLFIPALTLSYGLYEFKLIARIIPYSLPIESKSLFIEIIPSNITVYLIEPSTSLISHGQGKDLIIDPGRYSIDPDDYAFNASVSFRTFSVKTLS